MDFNSEIKYSMAESDESSELKTLDILLEGTKCLSNDTEILNPVPQLIKLEDNYELELYGYKQNSLYAIFCWVFMVLSLGIFGVICYSSKIIYFCATHSKCSLTEANKILIKKKLKNRTVGYHVKNVYTLNCESLLKISDSSAENYEDYEEVVRKNLEIVKFTFLLKKMETIRYFNYEKLRYMWDPNLNQFYQLKGLDDQDIVSYAHEKRGLSSLEQYIRRVIFGCNKIVLPRISAVSLVSTELLSPFFIVQCFSLVIWLANGNLFYSIVTLLMSLSSIMVLCLLSYFIHIYLRKQIPSSGAVHIIRDKMQVTISSEYLVPGDILVLPKDGCFMKCDAILLNGTCVVNESSFTGTSDTIIKTAAQFSSQDMYENIDLEEHTLFYGTEILEAKSDAMESVFAIVVRTGFSTIKGSILRKLLYPPAEIYHFKVWYPDHVTVLSGLAVIKFVYAMISACFGVDLVTISGIILNKIVAAASLILPIFVIQKCINDFMKLTSENIIYTKNMKIKSDNELNDSEKKLLSNSSHNSDDNNNKTNNNDTNNNETDNSYDSNYDCEVKWLDTDLIVLGLPCTATDQDLRDYFSKFGKLQLAQIKMDPITNLSKGYGFVRFVDREVQVRVLLQKHCINNRFCDVRIPESKINLAEKSSNKVFIGQCTRDLTENVLRDYFSQFGSISDLYVPQPFRGFAFVTFVEADVAKKVCAENHRIKDTNVCVTEAIPKEEMEKYERPRSKSSNRSDRDSYCDINYNIPCAPLSEGRMRWNSDGMLDNNNLRKTKSRRWDQMNPNNNWNTPVSLPNSFFDSNMLTTVIKEAVREASENRSTVNQMGTYHLFDSYEDGYCQGNRKRKNFM